MLTYLLCIKLPVPTLAPRVDLGTCYLYGRGVKQDYAQAAYWLNKAAELGHSAGLHRLGVLYWNGWGVPRDEPESVKLWIKVRSLINFSVWYGY